jgi:hypothetical protein
MGRVIHEPLKRTISAPGRFDLSKSGSGPNSHDANDCRYLLAGAAGGLVLSEPMPDAAPAGGLAMPDDPDEGVLVSAGGVDGIVEGVSAGVVEGVVAGGLMGAGEDVSSTFLPQAPSASSAESATAVAAGLN